MISLFDMFDIIIDKKRIAPNNNDTILPDRRPKKLYTTPIQSLSIQKLPFNLFEIFPYSIITYNHIIANIPIRAETIKSCKVVLNLFRLNEYIIRYIDIENTKIYPKKWV